MAALAALSARRSRAAPTVHVHSSADARPATRSRRTLVALAGVGFTVLVLGACTRVTRSLGGARDAQATAAAAPAAPSLSGQRFEYDADEALDVAWSRFKAAYGKHYKNPREDAFRKEVFTQALLGMTSRAASPKKGSAEFGVTKFFDWTLDEFMSLQTAMTPDETVVGGGAASSNRSRSRALRAALPANSIVSPGPRPINVEDLDAPAAKNATVAADDDASAPSLLGGGVGDGALGGPSSSTPVPTPCGNGGSSYCSSSQYTSDYYCEAYFSSTTGMCY